MNILITGLPGSGKTTLLRELTSWIDGKIGFYTREIRDNGNRTGFEIIPSVGQKKLLASITMNSGERVGKYGVDPDALSSIFSDLIHFPSQDLLYIDEIGQMEFLSEGFEDFCLRYIEAPNLCIATISQVYNNDCIDSIRQRPDVIIFEITPENRDQIREDIRHQIQKHFP